MTRRSALADASDGGERPHAGKTSTGAIGESDKVLQRPAQRRAHGAVQVKADGDVSEQRSLRGCSATRPEAADFGALCRCTPKGLAKIGGFGKSLDCHTERSPASSRYGRPALRGGFCFMGVSLAGLA